MPASSSAGGDPCRNASDQLIKPDGSASRRRNCRYQFFTVTTELSAYVWAVATLLRSSTPSRAAMTRRFLVGFEAIENAIEKEGSFVEASLEQAEIAAVEFDPEARALQVLHPPGPEVAAPVLLHPGANRAFSEVALHSLTLDPLVGERFF